MTAASNYAASELVDHLLGTGAYTMPTQVYVKMHTGVTGDGGTTNAAAETTRKQADFGAATNGVASNSAEIEWLNVSTTETWSHYSIWDDLTAGNCLLTGALTTPRALTAADDAKFAVGALTVTIA